MADKIVQIPNIGAVKFPDTMSDDDILKAIGTLLQDPATSALASAPAPAPAPRQPKTVTEKVLASPVGGVIRGLRDIPDAGAQLLTRGLEAISPSGSSMEKFMQAERRRVEDINREAERAYQQDWRMGQMRPDEFDVGRAVGGAVATAIPATTAVKALGLTTAPVRAGAVSGVIGGGLQPVLEPQDSFAAQKATQIGLGGALGAGGGYLGDKITNLLFGRGAAPAVGGAGAPSSAQATVSATPTAQVTGGGVNLGSVAPESGAALTAAQKAILERGKAMGFKTTPAQETGSRSLLQMEARMESSPFTSAPFNTIKAENQKVLNRATAQAIGVNSDELSNPVLAQAQRQISDVYKKVATPDVRKVDGMTFMNNIDLIDNAFEGLTKQPLKTNILVKRLQELALKGEASGVQLQSLSSKLGKSAKNEMTTAMGERDLGSALFQLKEMVDDALSAGLSKAEQEAFATARNNYRNLMTIRTASGVVNPSSGNVSGLNLASALTRKDPQGFVFGSNQTPMYEAARFAQAFRPIVGDSGTATRSMEYSPLNMLLSMPTNLAARAYTSAPASSVLTRAVGGTGLMPNALEQAQVESLKRALPITGGLGLGGLLGP
jgi:hypothetical protein